jgi:cysteine synthase A
MDIHASEGRVGPVWDLVGNTPLVEITSLSQRTGCRIYGKAEFCNPGGSVKDRAAKGIIADAEARGLLVPHSDPPYTIVEGTAGNTGIGLATLAAERGYKVLLTMPDDQAAEKYAMLRALGVELDLAPPCPFANPNHFYHRAQRIAESMPRAFWANQFENEANGNYHYHSTGAEIWAQTGGKIDVFTCSAGTSGTISGVTRYLKDQRASVRTVLADPYGSGMYCHLTAGKIETEGRSVTEGIGIMRLTANFKAAQIDEAMRVSDREMIDMLYHLARHDGLVVGTSAALNVAAAYRLAQARQGSGAVIVTILCDHGTRYQSRVLNEAWLQEKDLVPQPLA